MRKVARIADVVSFGAASTGALFLVAMVVLVSYGVIMRFLVQPTVGTDEISTYLLVGIIFLGLGYVLKDNAHVTIDLVTTLLSARIRKGLSFATSVLALLYVGVLIWTGCWFAIGSFQLGSTSASSLQTPMFLPQSLLPAGLLVFALQLLAHLYRIRVPDSS